MKKYFVTIFSLVLLFTSNLCFAKLQFKIEPDFFNLSCINEDPNSDIKLQLIDFEIDCLPENYDLNRFRPSVKLTLHLKNNTVRRIKAWRVTLIAENSFGDILFKSRLTDGTADIKKENIEKSSFIFKDNIFIDDQPYDKLVSYSKENLKISITDIQLVQ